MLITAERPASCSMFARLCKHPTNKHGLASDLKSVREESSNINHFRESAVYGHWGLCCTNASYTAHHRDLKEETYTISSKI